MANPDARDSRDDAFIREVDDEYRRAQLESFWQRYGRILAIGVVVVLILLGALLYWREDRAQRAGAVGEAFNLALTRIDAGNVAAAAPVLARLAADGPAGYAALARLEQAAVAVPGDPARALALYRGLAADAAVPAPLRDLATIKAVRQEFDTLPPATVVARLRPFAVPGDPWFAVAAEMTGVAELKLGQRDRAAPLFVAIVRDTAAPPSLRNRAAQLAVSLGVDPATLLARAPAGTAK